MSVTTHTVDTEQKFLSLITVEQLDLNFEDQLYLAPILH